MALLKRKRVGLSDAMSVVTRFVNACNRHDADGVASCLHPDFDSIQPMHPSRNFRGADQVRRNWQAIFDAEPGFRLTVLRSAAVDDTVWLELHGAGRDAEVAGVFIMGIQGDRVRWARIYSALVEPVPAGMEDATAASTTLHEVRSGDEQPAAGNGEVVEEAAIAPVVDIERPGRRRRRSARRGAAQEVVEPPAAEEPTAAEPTAAVAAAEPEIEPEPEPEAEPVAEPQVAAEPEVVVEAEPEVMVAGAPEDQAEVAAEPQVVSEVVGDDSVPEVVAETLAEPEVAAVVVDEEPEVAEPDPHVVVWPAIDEDSLPRPDPEVEVQAEAAEPPAAADVPPPVDVPTSPKRRFGRRGR